MELFINSQVLENFKNSHISVKDYFYNSFSSESPTCSKPNHFSSKFVLKPKVINSTFRELQNFIVSYLSDSEKPVELVKEALILKTEI